jgi:ribosome-associated heat shock protein Hsp15
LLWFLRLTPTRSAAQALVAAGHVRIDGRRIAKAGTVVRAGALLVLPTPRGVRCLRIERLPHRRGSAVEVGSCLSDLDAVAGQAGDPAPARLAATDSQHGAHA